MTRSLTDLSQSMDELDRLIAQHDGAIDDPAIVAALTDMLAGDVAEFTLKVDAYVSLIEEMNLRAQARKESAQRLAALAATDDKAAGRLKDRLLAVLQHREIQKLDTTRFRLFVQSNPPSVRVDDGCYAPQEFYEWGEPHLKKKELLAALKAGDNFEGCHIVQGVHLRIK